MVQVYNFLSSWQLFPEKGSYPTERPRSGIYRVEAVEQTRTLRFYKSWVRLDGEAFETVSTLEADGDLHAVDDRLRGRVILEDSIRFAVEWSLEERVVTRVIHEILPNGYLQLSISDTMEDGQEAQTREIYHKQMSVLPYASSVAGAVIRPTEEGVIKHKALTAMEQQTNMQLQQIREQIELLAMQAQTIHQRKELSMKIYSANLSFRPNIGQTYYLYEKKNGDHLLSLVSPKEWGSSLPFRAFVAAVQLLADHTWMEL